MKKKIFISLISLVAAVVTVVFLLVSGLSYNLFLEEEYKTLALEASLMEKSLEQEPVEEVITPVQNQELRITIIDPDGSVFYDNKVNPESCENHAERKEVRQAKEQGEGRSLRYSISTNTNHLYYAKLMDNDQTLRLSVTKKSFVGILLHLLIPLFLVSTIIVVVAYFVSKKLAYNIVEPINALDLSVPSKDSVYKEIEPLVERIQTQNKEIDEQRVQLEIRDQDRKNFTANVSHELKTPLQTIMGSSELLALGVVSPSDIPDFATSINQESIRLLELIDSLMELSRLEEKKNYLKVTTFDIDEVLNEVHDKLEPKASLQGVRILLSSNGERLSNYRELVFEIVYNLVDNAIKYNIEKGFVSVRTCCHKDHLEIIVEDNGIGIAEQELDKIFQRFYQVDKSSKDGTGLGLAIVKHALDVCQGTIAVESKQDIGTTITLTFVNIDE